MSRAEASQLKVGEEVTITFKDKRVVRSRFQGIDEVGIKTDQGSFNHDEILRVEAERFSPGETAARTVGLVYVFGIAAAYAFGKMLEHAFEGDK